MLDESGRVVIRPFSQVSHADPWARLEPLVDVLRKLLEGTTGAPYEWWDLRENPLHGGGPWELALEVPLDWEWRAHASCCRTDSQVQGQQPYAARLARTAHVLAPLPADRQPRADRREGPGMDDGSNKASRTLAVRLLLIIAVFALVSIPARDALGVRGVEVSLAVAIGAIALLAYCELTGRTLLSLLPRRRPSAAAAPAQPEDHWRSDRWVRETVENGWRALEEWRLEQRDA